jgi:hypothetical protein
VTPAPRGTERGTSASGRVFAWGVVAALCYVLVVMASQRAGRLPPLLLFDGFAPPTPYRWVAPPRELRATNQPPQPAAGTIALTASGSQPGSLTTDDGQAVVVFSTDAIEPSPGETAVRVTITPLDPGRVVPPALRRTVDGNAYRIDAVYSGSGKPAILTKRVTVLFRYPRHAREMWRSGEPNWTTLPAIVFPTTLQLYAESPALGTFALAGLIRPPSFWTRLLGQPLAARAGAVVGLAVLVVLAVLFLSGVRRRR